MHSEREMDLYIDLESSSPEGYCWLGLTKSRLGNLGGSKHTEVTLTVFPTRTGLINISGIRITDMKKGEKFIFNDIVQVFVTQEG
jgi:hypothetical protein